MHSKKYEGRGLLEIVFHYTGVLWIGHTYKNRFNVACTSGESSAITTGCQTQLPTIRFLEGQETRSSVLAEGMAAARKPSSGGQDLSECPGRRRFLSRLDAWSRARILVFKYQSA